MTASCLFFLFTLNINQIICTADLLAIRRLTCTISTYTQPIIPLPYRSTPPVTLPAYTPVFPLFDRETPDCLIKALNCLSRH